MAMILLFQPTSLSGKGISKLVIYFLISLFLLATSRFNNCVVVAVAFQQQYQNPSNVITRISNHQQQQAIVVVSTTSFYTQRHRQRSSLIQFQSSSTSENDGETQTTATKTKTKRKPLWPKVGDIVRYYDLDGGKIDGQVLVGRISYIQKKLLPKKGQDNNNNSISSDKTNNEWLFEISELDNIGDGYYTDYSMNKRGSKKTIRDGILVSPIAASYVRSEDAYKVPIEKETNKPMVRATTYDLDTYPGPFGTLDGQIQINQDIIQTDRMAYDELKNRLIKSTIIAGAIGTILIELIKNDIELAVIYAAGSLASVIYLLLLALKTDTMASADGNTPKLGNKLSNLRFFAPIPVMIGIALYNQNFGTSSITGSNSGMFTTMTPDQFAAAIFGFLTYRIPLFFTQIQDAIKSAEGGDSSSNMLPGSAAGMTLQLIKEKTSGMTTANLASTSVDALQQQQLQTVLLISGPQAAGRSELVKQFMIKNKDDERFVVPKLLDNVQDSVTFERMDQRGEILSIDPTGRYGFTTQSVMNAVKNRLSDNNNKVIVVVDADVALAKEIVSKVSNIRIVGVWVGLDEMKQFENRLDRQINDGTIIIPPDETRDSIVRARIKEIVQEIEYGISSGIFEFTIINNNEEDSLRQLEDASSYCFLE